MAPASLPGMLASLACRLLQRVLHCLMLLKHYFALEAVVLTPCDMQLLVMAAKSVTTIHERMAPKA